jgi:hypothetical protein
VSGALPEEENTASLQNVALFRILCLNQAVVAVQMECRLAILETCRIQVYSYMIAILKQEIGTSFFLLTLVGKIWCTSGIAQLSPFLGLSESILPSMYVP